MGQVKLLVHQGLSAKNQKMHMHVLSESPSLVPRGFLVCSRDNGGKGKLSPPTQLRLVDSWQMVLQ